MTSGWVPPNSKQILDGIGIQVHKKMSPVNEKGSLTGSSTDQVSKTHGVTLLHMDVYPKRLAANDFFVNLLQASLYPDAESFKPIPFPDEDDWLGWHNTKNQSFKRCCLFFILFYFLACDFETCARRESCSYIFLHEQICELKGCKKAQKKL